MNAGKINSLFDYPSDKINKGVVLLKKNNNNDGSILKYLVSEWTTAAK